ncbi:MAG: caspase family protein [Anaerolineae bacterium]|nr:caspase family protein [Anaerolineae bacterium]
MTDLLDKYTGSYALVVGIDHYPDPRFSPLGNAEADAREVMEVLSAPPYRFEVSGLFGEEATRHAILDKLFDLESTAPNDRVIIYFAGHGYTLVDNFDRESGYLACFDTIPERHHTALRMDDVVDFRARAGAKHIAFIFDACFSGQALGLTRSAAVTAAGRFMKLRAYHAISAGGPGETVADAQSMTRLLVEALRHPERVDPKLLTIEKLGAYLRERMVSESRSIQTPQFGQLSGSGGGDMVLFALQPGETADLIFSVLPGPFDWVRIPRGPVIPRNEHAPIYLPDYMISKYPVTNDQFQVFVEAPDGYVDVRWWDYCL